ncbi:hypothetical protein [Azotobacter chroococcum]|uniref:PIN domain-containing protein n=1 Tax=Azotobacter chroococcum NCIMB 8003 TaxID=1328314 RepID=A0A0C4WUS5_9GAMM|nr:hypothetical protein [Azotobacter chroococcum]AJE23665.1 Hypothetical protein Achr_e740 [Azotobacter chroococcum NCIMB 8003]
MATVVIDTNVLLVANQQHADVSPECIAECVQRLLAIQNGKGVVVVDDAFRILGEYQHKTSLNPPKGVGDVFLKWLLRNVGKSKHVQQVRITELAENEFAEFPDAALQPRFDAPDRKFAAVANAHPHKPAIWQAADCKWLDWWRGLAAAGVQVKFLCPDDACRFYQGKFPGQMLPELP